MRDFDDVFNDDNDGGSGKSIKASELAILNYILGYEDEGDDGDEDPDFDYDEVEDE
jgi:hypothetical protein